MRQRELPDEREEVVRADQGQAEQAKPTSTSIAVVVALTVFLAFDPIWHVHLFVKISAFPPLLACMGCGLVCR